MSPNSAAPHADALLSPGVIGGVELPNRILRSSTSETLADSTGCVLDPDYARFCERLADGGVGLLLTGHIYVHPRGQSTPGMTGLSADAHIAPLAKAVQAVHDRGARMFAQLQHAGSQSKMPGLEPLAPSRVHNPQTGHMPAEASEAEIRGVIDGFGAAARRAQQAGFDGVHIHAGHGYLLSEFLSPSANRRGDQWGGPLENRQRLLLEVVNAVLSGVDRQTPVTVKLGMRDFVPDGLSLDREPDLVRTIEAGRTGAVDCTSCNICIQHEGVHPLQCWRQSNKELLRHAYYRFSGKLK